MAGPIDRTGFNTWVDGTTVLTKARFDTDILDPVDAALLTAGAGDVVGPASSVNNRIAAFNGTTGKLVQDGGQTIAEVIASVGTNAINLTGGQIAFPATQVPSADANTLDDYEEGTWTPTIGGTGGQSGQTYSAQVGSYVKIGQFVIATFQVALTAKGTITGNCVIRGIPFPPSSAVTFASLQPLLFVALATPMISVSMVLNLDSTVLLPAVSAATVNNTTPNLTGANLTDTTALFGTILYRAAA